MDDTGFKNKVSRIKELASIDVKKNFRNNIMDIQSIYSDIHKNPISK